jgi:hypothetical protein
VGAGEVVLGDGDSVGAVIAVLSGGLGEGRAALSPVQAVAAATASTVSNRASAGATRLRVMQPC